MVKKISDVRGIGHVEMIISFVLFLGFLSFIFIAFNPLKVEKNNAVLDSLVYSIEENLGVDVSRVSIASTSDWTDKNCVKIKNDDLINDLKCVNRNIIIKGEKINGDEINLEYFKSSDKSFEFEISSDAVIYNLYCSDEFGPSTSPLSGCKNINEKSDYNIGIIVDKKYYSDKKLEEFENRISSDYDALKKEYAGSSGDIGFEVRDIEGQIIYEDKKATPKGVDVMAKTFQIDVIDESANIKDYSMTVYLF